MAKYEYKESEFLGPQDVKELGIVEIEIVSEIKDVGSDWGPKPTGTVKYLLGDKKTEKSMRFNQIFRNYLIKKTESTDSEKWLIHVPITTKVIRGNLAIIPKTN